MKVDRSDLCPLYLGAERTLGAQVTFKTTRDGRAARLVLHQNSTDRSPDG